MTTSDATKSLGDTRTSSSPLPSPITSSIIPSASKSTKLYERRSVSLSDLSPEDRQIFVNEVENALLFYLTAGFPVYLDSLGLVFPERRCKERSRPLKDKLIVHREEVMSLSFEKCSELIGLHRERFPGVIEAREIGSRLFEHGIQCLSVSLSAQEVRKLLREFVQTVKREVIECGRCSYLPNVCDFYAIHNRQGETFSDWFAGADIFIVPRWKKTTKSDALRVFERPVLETPSELFGAFYGKPLKELEVDMRVVLTQLGFSVDEKDPNVSSLSIRVSIFESENRFNRRTFTYVSDGLRSVGHSKGKRGTECVIQVVEKDSDYGEPPTWPLLLLGGAWILLHASKESSLSIGLGMSLDCEELRKSGVGLSTLLIAEHKRFPSEQLAIDGPFKFRTLTLLDPSEAAVSSEVSPKTLLMLLERKHYDQAIKPGRIPLTNKTVLLAGH